MSAEVSMCTATELLRRGRIKTTYKGFYCDESGKEHKWPYGYEVEEIGDRAFVANCIYCVACRVAVVEVWKSSQGRFSWCSRRGNVGYADDREQAFAQGFLQLMTDGYACDCSPPLPKP